MPGHHIKSWIVGNEGSVARLLGMALRLGAVQFSAGSLHAVHRLQCTGLCVPSKNCSTQAAFFPESGCLSDETDPQGKTCENSSSIIKHHKLKAGGSKLEDPSQLWG